jgi:hypothetical protein
LEKKEDKSPQQNIAENGKSTSSRTYMTPIINSNEKVSEKENNIKISEYPNSKESSVSKDTENEPKDIVLESKLVSSKGRKSLEHKIITPIGEQDLSLEDEEEEEEDEEESQDITPSLEEPPEPHLDTRKQFLEDEAIGEIQHEGKVNYTDNFRQ